MDKEIEKLKQLNKLMREGFSWYDENSWNAIRVDRVSGEALKDVNELEKEIDKE